MGSESRVVKVIFESWVLEWTRMKVAFPVEFVKVAFGGGGRSFWVEG